MQPFFSIIIPIYNRESFIGRAIDSCLCQDYPDYELLIIDDGSSDNSHKIVKRYTDFRIRLISHQTNRGVGPARNTGVSIAKGKWIFFLDSDDELLPGALTVIENRCQNINNAIARLNFMVEMDNGDLSPYPPLKNELWDYVKYLQWMENSYGNYQESKPVIKRKTFETIKFKNDRTLETPYHLDFMKHFSAWSCPDVIVLYHQDAQNQLTKPDIDRSIDAAHDQAKSEEIMIKRHGHAIKKYAPRVHNALISGMATLFFLSGDRQTGIRYSFDSLRNNFFSIRNWTILIFGITGPRTLAWAKALWSRLYQIL